MRPRLSLPPTGCRLGRQYRNTADNHSSLLGEFDFLPLFQRHQTCIASVGSTVNQSGREYRLPDRTFGTACTNSWLLGNPTNKPGLGAITISRSGKTNSPPVKSSLR